MKGELLDLACVGLRDTAGLARLSQADWDPLIRQARRADVLARLAEALVLQGDLACVPERPREHLLWALRTARAQHVQTRREAGQILSALRELSVPVLFLKGAAYVLSSAPAALGRMSADVDIMVPRSALADVETRLMLNGWFSTHHDAYDQRYYREWMHELPPLHHRRRGTTLDVHHNIMPLTVRRPVAAERLFERAKPLVHLPGAFVLDAPDMVLHSLTHLIHNDDLSHALRDLSDVDLLLKQHAQRIEFWPDLMQRAQELNLQRPLYYGLWAASRIMGTAVPEDVLAACSSDGPAWPVRGLMQALLRRGLRTAHPLAELPMTAAALMALHVRAHWLRMPPFLLAMHLARKSWRRLRRTPTAMP
jgi:hypothetical protein